MVLLTAKHIQKRFSEKQLLEDINISIHLGDKIGLVGVNGSGKSTLLQIIAGAMEEDAGEILRSNELRIGYLPQNPDLGRRPRCWSRPWNMSKGRCRNTW